MPEPHLVKKKQQSHQSTLQDREMEGSRTLTGARGRESELKDERRANTENYPKKRKKHKRVSGQTPGGHGRSRFQSMSGQT